MNLSRALEADINYFIDVPKGSNIVRRAAETTNMSLDPVRILWVGTPALFG